MKFFYYAVLISAVASAAPGCMENSWHLTKLFDTKTHHPVVYHIGKHETHCPCVCDIKNGVCVKCHHRNDQIPGNFIIIKYDKANYHA